jgi:hypothetical protein
MCHLTRHIPTFSWHRMLPNHIGYKQILSIGSYRFPLHKSYRDSANPMSGYQRKTVWIIGTRREVTDRIGSSYSSGFGTRPTRSDVSSLTWDEIPYWFKRTSVREFESIFIERGRWWWCWENSSFTSTPLRKTWSSHS